MATLGDFGSVGYDYASSPGTGRFPDEIMYHASQDLFRLSVAADVSIDPLAHVQIVNYDVDTAPPYTMNLNLPLMGYLPGKGRIYFFYVSYCHDGDTLTFTPYPGSGDSVNGNLGSFSFTLDGIKTLFIAVGVAGNWLIHPFNNLVPPAPTATYGQSGAQSYMLQFQSPTPQAAFWTDAPAAVSSCFYPNAAAMDTLTPFGIDDISGYFNENVLVPTKTIRGFECVEPGWYEITHTMGAAVQFDSASGNNVWADLGVFTSAGVQKSHWRSADCSQSYYVSTTNYPNAMVSQYTQLDAGDIVVFSYSLVGASVVTSTYTSAFITFIYYGPTYTPPVAPLMMRMAADGQMIDEPLKKAPEAKVIDEQTREVIPIDLETDPSSFDPPHIIIGGKFDKELQRKTLHLKHMSAKKNALQEKSRELGSLRDLSAPGSLSLADVESIVQKVLRSNSSSINRPSPLSQEIVTVVPESTSSSAILTSSSASSSSSSSSRPPSKKRSRTAEKEAE